MDDDMESMAEWYNDFYADLPRPGGTPPSDADENDTPSGVTESDDAETHRVSCTDNPRYSNSKQNRQRLSTWLDQIKVWQTLKAKPPKDWELMVLSDFKFFLPFTAGTGVADIEDTRSLILFILRFHAKYGYIPLGYTEYLCRRMLNFTERESDDKLTDIMGDIIAREFGKSTIADLHAFLSARTCQEQR